MRVRLTSDAKQDLASALTWYRARQAGLDGRFLEALDAALHTISGNPEISPKVYQEVRRYLLRGFPYGIFYVADPDEIVVVGCFHGARDPSSWPKA